MVTSWKAAGYCVFSGVENVVGLALPALLLVDQRHDAGKRGRGGGCAADAVDLDQAARAEPESGSRRRWRRWDRSCSCRRWRRRARRRAGRARHRRARRCRIARRVWDSLRKRAGACAGGDVVRLRRWRSCWRRRCRRRWWWLRWRCIRCRCPGHTGCRSRAARGCSS